MRNAPRQGKVAAAWASRKVGAWCPYGMCQGMTHAMFGTPPCGGSAVIAWTTAQRKVRVTDPATIPIGVPVYWCGGSHGYGHAATSIGGGKVVSTDWPRANHYGVAKISDICSHWSLKLLGYVTVDANGYELR